MQRRPKTESAAVAAGGKSPGDPGASSSASKPAADPSSVASTTGSSIDAAAKEPPKPAPALATNLHNDAFKYYGLGDTKSHDVELVVDKPGAAKQTINGSMRIEFEKMDGSAALYKVSRTGAISSTFGDDDLKLDPKGLVQVGTSLGTVTQTSLEMPATLKPGTTWISDGAIKGKDGNTQTQHVRYTVVGETDVATKAGKFHALEIKSHGSVTGAGSGSVDVDEWYVADQGLVKSVIKITAKKQKATITLERLN